MSGDVSEGVQSARFLLGGVNHVRHNNSMRLGCLVLLVNGYCKRYFARVHNLSIKVKSSAVDFKY